MWYARNQYVFILQYKTFSLLTLRQFRLLEDLDKKS